MQRANLNSLLENFRKFGRDAAVVERRGYRWESRTYAELTAAAESWSAFLAVQGIGSGDRVVLWGANSARWIAAFWGLMLRGAVAVPMDAGAACEFVERTTRESGAKLVLRDKDLPEPPGAIATVALDDIEDDGEPAQRTKVPAAASRSDIAEILF